MITVKLFNGQVLTFPDGTPDSVIKAAAERATAGSREQKTGAKLDLSSLAGKSGEVIGGRVGSSRPSQDAELARRGMPTAKPSSAPVPDDELPKRSPEWWKSVSGTPDSKAATWERQRQLQQAESAGADAMSQLGFEDHETYYLNPGTGERVLKRRKTGDLPEPLDPKYRPVDSTPADRLRSAYEMEGRPVPSGETLAARKEWVAGVPARVMGSMAGLALPLQAAEAVGRGLKEEAKNLATGDHVGRPTGEGIYRGVRQGWTESPITQGVGAVQERVVEPARERYLDAAIRAGMSPEEAALAESGQALTGELLNPGNYVGMEMLRTGAQMSRTAPASLARRAAEESVGGARALEEAGIVTREFGKGSAPSEILQRQAARSGEFLPGAREPLLYRDPAGYGGVTWKGVIPDTIRELRGDPWRSYQNVDMKAQGLGEVSLKRPVGPEPRPRSIEGRKPLPMQITGGTPEDQARIGGLWDYASKRYPMIASRVREVEIGPLSFFEPTTGKLQLAPDADLGYLMHELTHVAQEARGVFDRVGFGDVGVFEPAAMRVEDVYSRIPQPQPRRIQATEAVGAGQVVANSQDISQRFADFLTRSGIKDPEYYYDLAPDQRAILDRQFAANDAGPDTVAWSAYLLEHNLRPDDYINLPLPDRAKMEGEFWHKSQSADIAARTSAEDAVDDALPSYYWDNASNGWRVEGADQVFDKEWQAKEFRDSFRAYAGDRSGNRGGWLGRLFGGGDNVVDPAPALVSQPVAPPAPPPPARLILKPAAIQSPDAAVAELRALSQAHAENELPINPAVLPFELRDLPLSRWTNADPSRRMRGSTNPAHWDFDRAGGYWRLGDATDLYDDPVRGGKNPVAESFTPANPLVLPDRQTGLRQMSNSGWEPSTDLANEYDRIGASERGWQDSSLVNDRMLNDYARSLGHDSIILVGDGNKIEVIKLGEGVVGTRRISPYLQSFAEWQSQLIGQGSMSPAVRDRYIAAVMDRTGIQRSAAGSVADLLRVADQIEEVGQPLIADMLREKAGPLHRAAAGKPFRVYAGHPISPQQPIPAAIAPSTPEQQAAAAMGWLPPPGSPTVAGPPIRLPEFQTNIAAQLGGDEALTHWVIEQSDAIFKEIGPPQTWDTLEEMALRMGTSKEDMLANSSHWQVMSPELRLRLLYIAKDNEAKIQSLQAKLVKGEASDIEKAEILRRIDSRGDFVRLGAKTGSAYGRALNSLKMEARLALDDNQLLRQQLYRQYSKQLDAEKPLMEALARLDPSNPEELQTFLRAVNKPSFREYVQEYWISSILSGPATHERNLIGNAVNAVMENAVVRPLSAGFDAARVAGTGAERAIYLRETPAAVVGLTRGIRQGVRRGLEVLKRGYDPDAMTGKLYPVRSAFARSQNPVVRDVVGPVVTMPLRLLAASDAVFKSMNFTAELYAQAARIASKEGLSNYASLPSSALRATQGIDASFVSRTGDWAKRVSELVSNPTDEMMAAADSFALKATFNDDASDIGKAIMGLRDQVPVIGGFIIPFVKIADRLMVRGFEYSPVGAAKSVMARRAGNFAQSADLAARSSIGATVLAYVASLAMEGRLTAGAPTDEAEKAAFFGAGKQAWSVRTDDGTWIPYGGLQPIGTPFAIAASAWKGWIEHQEEPNLEKLGHAAAEIGVYVTDQSYMDGLSKFMDAIGGNERERGRAFSDLATNTLWGFAPYSGLTRSVARGIDPRVADADRIADRLWQNVPGVSLGMDARLTPWGEEVVPTGGRLRSVLAPGSILLPSREKQDPLDHELDRLGMPLGYVGKTLSDKLGKSTSRGRWKLTPDEWYYYQQTAGRTTRKLLERLYSKPGYLSWDVERQREETEVVIGKAREYARIQTVRRHRGLGHV